jgi:hypothetical protein
MKYAQMVLNDPSLYPKLLDILFRIDDKVSCRAAWVLEFVCGKDLESFIPYLELFTKDVGKVHLDSAVRPVAKICEYLVLAYYSKKDNPVKKALKPIYQERIIEACFDWMINDEKIAPKAYSMNSLYLLGQDHDWIHPELKSILERDFQMQSSGFKARARHILAKINKAHTKNFKSC